MNKRSKILGAYSVFKAVAGTNVIVNAAASVAVSADSSVVMDASQHRVEEWTRDGSANLEGTDKQWGWVQYVHCNSWQHYLDSELCELDGGEITALNER